MVGAARQESVEQDVIETLWRGKRVAKALERILVEVEPGRAERQVEVGDDHVALER